MSIGELGGTGIDQDRTFRKPQNVSTNELHSLLSFSGYPAEFEGQAVKLSALDLLNVFV